MSTGRAIVDVVGGLWPSHKLTETAANSICNGPLRDFSESDIASVLQAQFNTDPDARAPNWKAARSSLYSRKRLLDTQPRGDGGDWVRAWLRASEDFAPRFELCHSDIGPLALELWFDVVQRDMAYGQRFGAADPEKFRGDEGQQRYDKTYATARLCEVRGQLAEAWRLDAIAEDLRTHIARRTAALAELERRAKQLRLPVPGPQSHRWHESLHERIGHEWNRLGTRYDAFPDEATWKDDAPWNSESDASSAATA